MRVNSLNVVTPDAPLTAAPIHKEWIEGGDPRASSAVLSCSDDRAASMILWECTAGRFTWRYNVDETIYFLDGEVFISTEGQPRQRYAAGDSIYFPRGAKATWEVETFIRKVAFCRAVPPRSVGAAIGFARGIYRRLRRGGGSGSPTSALG